MPGFDRKIAVDLDPRRRPGVPMEWQPQFAKGAQWPIPRQDSEVKVFRHGRPKEMPRVFGTAQPPKGAAGVLRALAYRYPDHLIRHWIALMLADRVDVATSRFRRTLPMMGAMGIAAFGVRRWAMARRC